MNSIERISATLKFEKPDRVPVIAQIFGHAAIMEGVALGDYVKNGDLIARCQIKALERYGYDAVFSLMDVNVETEAAGSVLTYRRDQYPVIERYTLSKDDTFNDLSVPNPREAARMPEMLKALSILRREIGDEVLVVGCVLGPLTLTMQLLGAETALYMAIDEPERFSRLLDFSVEVIIEFGLAQLEAGAHLPLVFDPSGSPAVVPFQFFREFEFPRLKKVFEKLKEAGAVANWLHIAGPVESILPLYPRAGVDIANFDYCVKPKDARAALPHTCLDGNIKPLSFIEASPEEIAIESSELLKFFAEGGGFILSSGCEIPPESKQENVAAIVMAARENG